MKPIPMLVIVFIIHASVLVSTYAADDEDFFVIAHQMNTIQSIDHAMAVGANAVEIDLRFSDKGEPTHFNHGHPCDCDCYVTNKPWICTIPNICSQFTRAIPVLQHLSKFPNLALIWIDSKTSYLNAIAQTNAARKVFRLAQDLLLKKGYKGKFLVGSPNAEHYLNTLAYLSHHSPYSSQFFFSKDEIHNDPVKVMKYLTTLSSRNLIYDDGLTACSPEQFYDQIKVARINKLNGVVSSVFAWTVDSTESFEKYYSLGARGIITNRVVDLLAWAKQKGLRLAQPGKDSLRAATSKNVISPTCDCSHQNSGCIVSQAAPPYSACQCSSTGTSCSGSVVLCQDSDECKRMSDTYHGTSVQSCVEGGGDCDGYDSRCECKYLSGGCILSKPSQPHTACRCSYLGAWTCAGSNVRCLDTNDAKCAKPDATLASCILGGGNCDAYEPEKCKCEYHAGGCRISVEAPVNTACQCNYVGAWTCSGFIVRCRDVTSPLCLHPDKSKESCELGGGDCGAYGEDAGERADYSDQKLLS